MSEVNDEAWGENTVLLGAEILEPVKQREDDDEGDDDSTVALPQAFFT